MIKPSDLERLTQLARYLGELHAPIRHADAAVRYRRAIRDLVGSGEGIFGIVDAYPDDLLDDRVRRIEAACTTWRQKLRGRHHRARQRRRAGRARRRFVRP